MAEIFRVAPAAPRLGHAPIVPDWVRAGTPMARATEFFHSADGTSFTAIWDCTAGSFDWTYGYDETIHILEGSVILQDSGNGPTRLGVGDAVFLPKGAQVHWVVEDYVKKMAFFRHVVPNPILKPYMMLRRLKHRLRGTVPAGVLVPALEAV